MRLYGSNNPTGFTCKSTSKVNTLAAALRIHGEEDAGAGPPGTSVECNGFTWSVFEGCQVPGTPCEGQPGSTVELVVDGEYCGCGAGSNVLRPGIGTSGWGGLNSDPCAPTDQTMVIDFIAEGYADTVGPVVVSCPPADIVARAEAGQRSAVVAWPAPTARDYHDNVLLTSLQMAPLVTPLSRMLAGATPTADADTGGGGDGDGSKIQATFALGSAAVSYTFADEAGNAGGTCSFSVVVKDGTAPTFAGCPAAMSFTLPAADAGVVVDWTAPSASDDLDGTVAVGTPATHPTAGLSSGSTFPAGNTTVTYEVQDAAENKGVCSFVVHVVDVTAPVFTACPASFVVGAPANETAAPVMWPGPKAVDVADGADGSFTELIGPLTSPTKGLHSGSICQMYDTANIEYIAMDAAGNVAWCRFNVTVVDVTPPTFAGCPGSTAHILTAEEGTVVRSWTAPTASDFVDGDAVAVELVQSRNTSKVTPDVSSVVGAVSSFEVTATQQQQPGAIRTESPAGVFVYTYVAEDAAGNVGICAVTVNVTDATPPVVSGCEEGAIESTVLPGDQNAEVVWDVPTATDNVDGTVRPSVTGLPSGRASDGAYLFQAGEHAVTYRFQDGSGNIAVCPIRITVHYRVEPVFEVTAESGGFAAELSELADVGTVVKTFKILCSVPFTAALFDPAATTPQKYGTSSNGANDAAVLPFVLMSAGGAYSSDTYNIVTTEPLDREAVAAFALEVKATVVESGYAATGTFNVIVADANDNAPAFAVPMLYGFVTEGAGASARTTVDTAITLYAPNGTEVRSSAFDPDALQNGAVSYRVDGGGGRFGYDPVSSTLVLNAGSALDRETSSRVMLSVTATDGAVDDPRTTTVLVVITVEDVNDNAPVLSGAGLTNPFVVNSTLPGTIVGAATAFDQDADASLVYTIVAGSVSPGVGGEMFAVHRTSGLISVLAPLAEPPAQYTFVLTVSDGVHHTTKTMAVQVQPNPACVDRECVPDPCYGPPSCIGEGVCVLGEKVNVVEHPECNPVCTCNADDASGVRWPASDCGLLRTSPCPTDAYGMVTRTCQADGQWGDADFSSCVRTAILKLAAAGVSDNVDIDVLSKELAGASVGGEGLGALDVANIGVVLRDVAALSTLNSDLESKLIISQLSAADLVESASNTLDASVAVQRESQQVTSATTGTIEMTMIFSPWLSNMPLTAFEQNDLAAEVWRHAPQLSSIAVTQCDVTFAGHGPGANGPSKGNSGRMIVTFSAELRAAYQDGCLSHLSEMMAVGETDAEATAGGRRRAAPTNPLLAGLQADASGLYSGVGVDLALAPSYRDAPLSITTAVEDLLRSVAGGLAVGEVVRVETKNIAAEAIKLNCSAEPAPIVYAPPTASNDSITLHEAVVADRCAAPNAQVDVIFVIFEETALFDTAINNTNLTVPASLSPSSAPAPSGEGGGGGGGGDGEALVQECTVDPAARPPSRVMAVHVSSGDGASVTSAAAAAASAPMVSISMALSSAPGGYETSADNTMCVFWDHAEESWSSKGCSLVEDGVAASSSDRATCVCTSVDGHYAALPILKTCGLSGSATLPRPTFGLYLVVILTAVPAYFFVFVTFAWFSELRTVQKYILMHSSLAIVVALIVSSVAASRALEDGATGCRFSAALGYYMFLVVMVWQAMDAYHFWRTYTHVAGYGVHMGEKESQWPLFVTAYGVPILITAVVAAVSSEQFGTAHSCWLGKPASAAYWVPLVLTTLFNFSILVMISARQCGVDPDSSSHAEPSFNTRRETEFRRNLRANGVHLPFHTLAWAAGIVSVQDGSHQAFAAAFLVFATLAGGSSVLFNVLLEDEVWLHWGLCCQASEGDGGGSPKTPHATSYTHTSESQVEELALSDLGGRGPLSARSHPLSAATSNPRSAHSAVSHQASTVGVLPNLPNLAARSSTRPQSAAMARVLADAPTPLVGVGAGRGEGGGLVTRGGLKRSNSTDSRHKRRAATSSHQMTGYWEGIPVESLGRNATPNMHAPQPDEFSGFDSTSGDGWPQNRAEEEMYGMDVPLPGFPQTQVMLAKEHENSRGDLPPLHPSTWDAVARGASGRNNANGGSGNHNQADYTDQNSDSTDFFSSLNTANSHTAYQGIMVRDDLAAMASSPTKELLQQRENAMRWSAPLTTEEEQVMTDATLLRTAKVMALRDHKLTYLLHFEPGELRLLQDKLHEL